MSGGFPDWSAQRELLVFLGWVRSLGFPGAVLYGLIYVLSTVALLPGTILSLGAGAIYGPFWGTLIVVPASLTGAALAFLIARRLGRHRVERFLGGRAPLAALDRAMARDGFRLVLLMRLDPIFLPFAPLNYALGLTGVEFAKYVLASLLGMLPGSVLYVYLGSLVASLSQVVGGHVPLPAGWRPWLLLFGMAALVALVVLLGRGTRRVWQERVVERPSEEDRNER